MHDAAIRLRWMQMFQETGSAALVCARFGISRPTFRKWWRRFQQNGPAGLEETSRVPATSPNRRVFDAEEALILSLRRSENLGVHRLRARLRDAHGLDISADTILKVLRRAGEKPLGGGRRPKAPPPRDPAPAPPDDVAAAITALITAGQLQPGEKLSESALGSRIGTGRTKVREALKQLAVSGLVVLQHHRGAFVAHPSLQEVEQAYAARRLIEGAIITDVARHCTAHDIRRLRQHLDQQIEAHTSGQRDKLVRLLTEFHLVISDLGENRILHNLLADLTAKTSLAVLLYDHGGHPSCAIEEHAQLIHHLAAGEAEPAKILMEHHLTTNQSRLRDRGV
jgi:DNA-binding GntR family transcriptional regulator/transposase-like protein